jgi:hypothetical protein
MAKRAAPRQRSEKSIGIRIFENGTIGLPPGRGELRADAKITAH